MRYERIKCLSVENERFELCSEGVISPSDHCVIAVILIPCSSISLVNRLGGFLAYLD